MPKAKGKKQCWIFLDFDGVLNSDAYYTKSKRAAKYGDIDPTLVARLNKLCEKTGAKVIISSSWRHDTSIQELRDILSNKGFAYPKRVIARTPDLGKEAVRGYEILAHIEKTKMQGSFVILDDTPDMDGVEDCYVRTNPKTGMTMADVKKAITMLQG